MPKTRSYPNIKIRLLIFQAQQLSRTKILCRDFFAWKAAYFCELATRAHFFIIYLLHHRHESSSVSCLCGKSEEETESVFNNQLKVSLPYSFENFLLIS
jgi:hypothetical protein